MGAYGKSFTLASKENVEKYGREARNFIDESKKWSSTRYAAATAVAEYIANKKGETIYPDRVGKGWVLVDDGFPDVPCMVTSAPTGMGQP